ncbi:condensation domain-containing protein [Kibdelosporangium phytohabitans]|uniref:Condensation domain-containing protein n=1 Tax=Kibdelosporangium phytohabitans TaxID=860235 RepID=A0A0N9HX31_9PSEU|nr:condensation domain-containing protein [Kibdelosporangium phytohabitans]ALG06660.1 hypothetical protein AOZ06_06735 [Kibdelosporangium phytohabitans]MBE1467873.1 hypothetical protein [Kibdelosporangium phytohabitans]
MRKPLAVWQRFALGFDADEPGWSTGPWFTMNAVVDVRGPLDVRRLEQAYRQLVDRNALLRTRIEDDTQVIRPEVPVELELADASAELLHAPVEFTALSPLRVRLAKVDKDRHLLCVHIHHMMADPVTLWALLAELAALYRGPLPAPMAQFWQYAEDQARLLEDGRTAAEAWWRRVAFTDLAVPSPTPEAGFALRQRVLTADEVTEVERFSRKNRSTMFVSLLAGIACAMQPYLGPGDNVLFNTLLSRRNRIEWRAMPGPCTVPAFMPLPRPPATLTGDYVAVVRDVVLGAQQNVMDPPTNVPCPFIEYLPDSRPQDLSFGAATGSVVDAAGPRDIGRAHALGIRARRTADGELFAHLSGDGIGWSKERTSAVCATLPWRVDRVSEVS